MSERYVISILIGPCSQEQAETAMKAAHETANRLVPGAGTALDYWDEEREEPGDSVPSVDILG